LRTVPAISFATDALVYLRSAPALYNRVLLSDKQCERIGVVLVSPRNPLNIGAAARAMANFGLSRLTVVAPYSPNWREAKSAVGAPDVLKNAALAETLADAVRDYTFIAGTGMLTFRKPEQRVVPLPDLPALVRDELDRGGRIAMVFGPEKHGLTREDLSYCHVLAEIPTDPKQPSMNLGQAVAVCLYELAAHTSPNHEERLAKVKTKADTEGRVQIAESGSLELLARLVEQVMEAANYSPDSMRNANQHDMRLMLRRLAPTEKDVRRILGLFRRILWRFRRSV
jgi:TrmH family RNA methyltransferase